jgi:arylsulfatase A-like enzyme
MHSPSKPNIIFILTDQLRAHATAFGGDPNVSTPNLDTLASSSVVFTNAISNCPICTPYRGCLLTGQYPLSHGLFMNDVSLDPEAITLGKLFRTNGYTTGYIGKWHVDGYGRSAYIPPERRQGFEYWKGLECSHDYFQSYYYEGTDPTKKVWEGYDAYAQTADALSFINQNASECPFLLVLSFGTPHNPYETAPTDLLRKYQSMDLQLRPNVPEGLRTQAIEELQGYYAHITAIDQCVGQLLDCLHKLDIERNTIVVFTSDHGDSIQSHCSVEFPGINKQRPYEESILVPLILSYPSLADKGNQEIATPLATPDILPTLLGLSGLEIPDSIQGSDFSGDILGRTHIQRMGVLIASYAPFADWSHQRDGREYRGIRTDRYTYVRDLEGAWLFFDNRNDPYQLQNLVHDSGYQSIQKELEQQLHVLLREQGDPFLSAAELRDRWGYTDIREDGAVRYTP